MTEIQEIRVKCAERFTKLEEKVIVLDLKTSSINELTKHTYNYM